MRKALYLLATISDRDFEWLLSAGKHMDLSAGQTLITEGLRIDALYIVLQGMFSVSVEAMGGQEIARIGSGEILGEISFIDARPPSATVKALEESVVWAIPRSQLNIKLGQDVTFASHFYQAIAAFLSDRLRNTVSRLGSVEVDPNAPDNDTEDAVNPQLSDKLEIAKARLEWLVNHKV